MLTLKVTPNICSRMHLKNLKRKQKMDLIFHVLINMIKCKTLFSMEIKKETTKSSSAVMIGSLRVKLFL